MENILRKGFFLKGVLHFLITIHKDQKNQEKQKDIKSQTRIFINQPNRDGEGQRPIFMIFPWSLKIKINKGSPKQLTNEFQIKLTNMTLVKDS